VTVVAVHRSKIQHTHFYIVLTARNHEIEELPNGNRFGAFNARYPSPPPEGVFTSIIHNYTNQVMVAV
jgi:hypothetical protein